MRSPLVVTLGAALLAGCGATQPGEVYPLTADVALARLEKVEVPRFVFGTVGMTELQTDPVVEGPDRVAWPVTLKGEELFRYSATIASVDAGSTRVAVALTPGNARVAKGMADNPDILRMYRDAMTEAVDAGLEGRRFAPSAIAPAATIAVLARYGDINAKFDRAAEEHARDKKSNLERAYAAQGMEY